MSICGLLFLRASDIKIQLSMLVWYKANLIIISLKTRATQSMVYPLAKIFDPVTLTFDLWPWKSIGFQIILRTKYVPRLVKIHWRMLILECSQGCYTVKICAGDLDLWPWKSIGFQIFWRTKYVPSLVNIQWKTLILECSQGCYRRTDGSVTISLRNFVGEGIFNLFLP